MKQQTKDFLNICACLAVEMIVTLLQVAVLALMVACFLLLLKK